MRQRLLAAFCILGGVQASARGNLTIYNKNNKPLTLHISTMKNLNVKIIKEIPPKGKATVQVQGEDFKGATTYDLEGSPHLFTGEKCLKLRLLLLLPTT